MALPVHLVPANAAIKGFACDHQAGRDCESDDRPIFAELPTRISHPFVVQSGLFLHAFLLLFRGRMDESFQSLHIKTTPDHDHVQPLERGALAAFSGCGNMAAFYLP